VRVLVWSSFRAKCVAIGEALGDVSGDVANLVELLTNCLLGGHKVIVFGNGGSSADASHFCAELTGRYKIERRAFPAICLNDSAFLTAVTNDYGFVEMFARGVEAFAKPHDLVIGISTSGKSQNVLQGLRRAHSLGARTVALFGGRDWLSSHSPADLVINLENLTTAETQEAHMSVLHTVVEIFDNSLVRNP
jgi:D-sedoheptulose 7-phosphate isomerase